MGWGVSRHPPDTPSTPRVDTGVRHGCRHRVSGGYAMSSKMLRLSYRELSERLKISRDAAKSRARRAGWTRIVDNHGVARFEVPVAVFDTGVRPPVSTPPQTVEATPPDTPPVPPPDTGGIMALQMLQDELARQAQARDKAETLARDLTGKVARLEAERDMAVAEALRLRQSMTRQTSSVRSVPKGWLRRVLGV